MHNMYNSDIFILFIDDPNNHEYQNTNNSNYNDTDNNYNYLPYHPGVVPTNEGLRVELEGNYNSNYVETSKGYRAELEGDKVMPENNKAIFPEGSFHTQSITRPGNPSTLIGFINPENNESYNIGIIEPTRSELKVNGIYPGQSNSEFIVYKSQPNVLDHLKSKVKASYSKFGNTWHKWEEKYDKMMLKNLERERKYNELMHKTHYVKGYGYLSNCQLRGLHRAGYSIWNGKVIRTPNKTIY